jgi:hypothetical protein
MMWPAITRAPLRPVYLLLGAGLLLALALCAAQLAPHVHALAVML